MSCAQSLHTSDTQIVQFQMPLGVPGAQHSVHKMATTWVHEEAIDFTVHQSAPT